MPTQDEVDALLAAARSHSPLYYTLLQLVIEADLKEHELYALNVSDYERGRSVYVRDRQKPVPVTMIAPILNEYLDNYRPEPRDTEDDRDAFFVSRLRTRLDKRSMRGQLKKYRDRLSLPRDVKLESLRHSVIKRPTFWLATPKRGRRSSGNDPLQAERDRRMHVFERSGAQHLQAGRGNRFTASILVDDDLIDRLGGKGGRGVALMLAARPPDDDVTGECAIHDYPSGTDAVAAIDAIKAACVLGLPVLVPVLGEAEARIGWIEDWDDETKRFLVGFSTQQAPRNSASDDDLGDFELETDREVTLQSERLALARQPRFKFHAIQRYGPACAVCDISEATVLQAAHLRPVRERGSDDPRNALVMCATHHLAFDADLYCVGEDLTLQARRGGPTLGDLRITRSSIDHLPRKPHPSAVLWRWNAWRERCLSDEAIEGEQTRTSASVQLPMGRAAG